MGKTLAEFTMSLDGFIAGPDDEVSTLFEWYHNGDTEVKFPNVPTFKVSHVSADVLRETWGNLGAMVTDRRDFEVSNAWGGKSPLGIPYFVVTHRAAPEWEHEDSCFTFVREGVEQAVALAQRVAGNKVVGVNGTSIVRQCLRAGLLDSIRIHLASMLLGTGIRLFDQFGPDPIHLERTRVVEGVGVTHLDFRVVK